MPKNVMLSLFLRYGLIQFGQYTLPNKRVAPYKLNLDWLASYPDALQQAADYVIEHQQDELSKVERLLCPFNALPLATLVSQRTQIPVVYSRSRGESIVQDLVGAYDIDHPTLFITYATQMDGDYIDLLNAAQRVGLHTQYGYILVGDCPPTLPETLEWTCASSILELAEQAHHAGYIPSLMQKIVAQWEAENK